MNRIWYVLGITFCCCCTPSPVQADEASAVWKPTDTQPLHYETTFGSKLDVLEEDIAIHYQAKLSTTLSIKKTDVGGDLNAILTVDRIQLSYGCGPYAYDSNLKEQKEKHERAMGELFEPVIGSRWEIQIDQHGKIIKADIPKGITQNFASPIAREVGGLGRLFTDQDFADLIVAPLTEMSPKKDKDGSTWTASRRFSNYGINVVDEFTTEKSQNPRDKHLLTCKLKLRPAKDTPRPIGIKESSGRVQFDLASGALESLSRTTTWKIVIERTKPFFVKETLAVKRVEKKAADLRSEQK